MLALSPLFSTYGWPSEDPISHEQINFFRQIETSELQTNFPLPQPQVEHVESTHGENGGKGAVVKKLNHNASERNRRKRVNSLYSFLRSLLPATDQTKKLSIPATVSRVLQYIPELQKEVERLIQVKEELLPKISKQGDLVHLEKQRRGTIQSSLSVVSACSLSDGEAAIQISTVNKSLLSEALQNLEEDGFLLLSASSFEAFGEWIVYNLHLQVQGTQKVKIEMLREKVLSFYEKRE